MLPDRQRTTANGDIEHYCTWCQDYHALAAFSPKSLSNRVYKCRASTVAANKRYRQSLPPKTLKCRRLLGKIRKRMGGGPRSKRVQVQDVESVVSTLYDDSDGGSGWRLANADVVFEAMHGLI